MRRPRSISPFSNALCPALRPVRIALCAATFFAALCARAQFQLQDSGTTASLRGISSPDNGVAWASGTGGTVLRTEDGGYVWQGCAMPPGAEKLDFRGVQAFDAQTALVMSSGKGDLSRVYKTTDGCRTWKLVFTNPDADGFFDAMNLNAPSVNGIGQKLDNSHAWGYVLGDPVNGRFALFQTGDGGDTWPRRMAGVRGSHSSGCNVDDFSADPGEAAFAAGNQSLIALAGPYFLFVTGGAESRLRYVGHFDMDGALCHTSAKQIPITLAKGKDSAGAFAVAAAPFTEANFPDRLVVVGGDYKLPDLPDRTAVSIHSPGTFRQRQVSPSTFPHGYRSSVAYDSATKTWITVGPNGTDISRDDGRNWSPLLPGKDDAPDADKQWNALALPFVVGPHGRIGRLRDDALRPAAASKPAR